MRILLLSLFITVGCSTHKPLKYKYTSSKSYLSSLTSEDIRVSKITLELKNKTLFASGMDSTYVIVKLYDQDGDLLQSVDPADLTLSTSEDIEAKPFSLKQGIYKAEILPHVRSKSIFMKVDWQDKVSSPEITLKMTVAPLKTELAPLHHEFWQLKNIGEIDVSRGSKTPENATDGFSFDNLGDNEIVDTKKHRSSQRGYSFDYLEQATQNIAMRVDDDPNGNDSHVMHSIFMFFPRKQLFTVEEVANNLNVTLPTGEKIVFQKDSKVILDGAFLEGPVDSNPSNTKRKFADLKYRGDGILLRVNARGQSPQLGEFEKTPIDQEYGISGSQDVLILNGVTGQRCRRPKTDFWEPLDVTPIEFKYPTDEAFDAYLKANCGFGLTK